MKIIKQGFLLLFIGLPLLSALAQVGINTESPQGIFHIDSQHNNNATGAPTLVQQADDVMVDTNGNMGIGTTTPTNKLHVKAATDPLRLEGLSKNLLNTERALVVDSITGVVRSGVFPVLNLVPSDVGTVIALNGKLFVAQEVTLLMPADFVYSATGSTPIPIGNLSNKIVDNYNTYSGNPGTNSFHVVADGTYLLTMNMQLTTTAGTSPVIGVWCDTDNKWVSMVNDVVVSSFRQTYTLIVAMPLLASKTYSFRTANTASTTINWESSGASGGGPVSFCSLKRLK